MAEIVSVDEKMIQPIPSRVVTARQVSIDDVDRRILAVLAEDGRVSIRDLAARVNVSRATAYNRFDRLVETGVISRFQAVVDPSALGHTVTALIFVNVDQGQWRNVMPQLGELPGVEYLALTSGAFDYVLLVRAPDVTSLRDVLLERLQSNPAVRSTQTSFVLNEHGRPVAASAP